MLFLRKDRERKREGRWEVEIWRERERAEQNYASRKSTTYKHKINSADNPVYYLR